MDAQSVQDSFGWKIEATMESRSHEKNYWSFLCYVLKEKIIYFLQGNEGSEAQTMAEVYEEGAIGKWVSYYVQRR